MIKFFPPECDTWPRWRKVLTVMFIVVLPILGSLVKVG